METHAAKNLFICQLAEKHRVIAHGRSRHTKDFDIWLEPFASAEIWAENLICALKMFPEAYVWSLAQRRHLGVTEIAGEIVEFGEPVAKPPRGMKNRGRKEVR